MIEESEMDNQEIMVSVCCICFNHEKYIEEALNGILRQKTNFNYEIIIHDDVSSDNSMLIANKYREAYPNIVKIYIEDENQWTKKVDILKKTYKLAKGKYIAICECDDYWIDEYKLQKQIDFLENNINYSACFHKAKKICNDEFVEFMPNIDTNRNFNINEIFNNWIIPTASFVFRGELVNRIPESKKFMYTDIVTFLTMASNGEVYFLNEVMSVYRQVDSGAILLGKKNKNTDQYIRTLKHNKELKKKFPKLSRSIVFKKNVLIRVLMLVYLIKSKRRCS